MCFECLDRTSLVCHRVVRIDGDWGPDGASDHAPLPEGQQDLLPLLANGCEGGTNAGLKFACKTCEYVAAKIGTVGR